MEKHKTNATMRKNIEMSNHIDHIPNPKNEAAIINRLEFLIIDLYAIIKLPLSAICFDFITLRTIQSFSYVTHITIVFYYIVTNNYHEIHIFSRIMKLLYNVCQLFCHQPSYPRSLILSVINVSLSKQRNKIRT